MSRISVSPGSTKMPISGRASRNTAAEMTRQKTVEVRTALRTPSRIRSRFSAPKFWATKVEKALPKSWTGI